MSDEKAKPKSERTGCWRCGSHDVDFINRWTKLAGGYHAKLCAECLNDWEVTLRDNPTHKELISLADAMYLCVYQPAKEGEDPGAKLAAMREREAELIKTLFAYGETWADDVIERPAPPPPPPPTPEEVAATRERRKARLLAQLEMLSHQEEESRLLDKKA